MRKLFSLLLLAISIQHAYAAPINSLDCSDDEIAGYADQSNYKKKRGFNTIPNTKEYIPAAIAKTAIENGEDAGDQCNTIFTEGVDTSKASEIYKNVTDILSDPVGSMSKVGEMASKRAYDTLLSMSEDLKKGLCKRLGEENAKNKAGDQIDRVYRDQTKDTELAGTRINSSEVFGNSGIGGGLGNGSTTGSVEDVVGKNFTYNIIKNQLGKNSSSIAKLLDFTNPNQADVIIKAGSGEVDNQLDKLEDAIFGK